MYGKYESRDYKQQAQGTETAGILQKTTVAEVERTVAAVAVNSTYGGRSKTSRVNEKPMLSLVLCNVPEYPL